MRFLRNIVLIILIVASFAFVGRVVVFAEDPTPTPTSGSSSSGSCSSVPECAEQKLDCGKCVEYLNSKKDEASSKAKTLSSEISVMDNQIKLTESRISATEQLIEEIEGDIDIAKEKISDLEVDIEKSTKALIGRINAVYQVGSIQPWQIFLTASNINDVFKRLTYLKVVQIYDKRKVYAAEQAKNDYNNQKEIFEDKEAEAEAQSVKLEKYNEQLEGEKAGKTELLSVTKNDEAKYQRLLSVARAERAVVTGGGKETFMRNVNAGDNIGTVISGASGCSTGTHLHFTMTQGGSLKNPSDYLSSKSFSYSYGSDLYGYYGTIDPHGSWAWPLDDPITINQGYGSHGYATRYPGGIHDGIDMEGGSLTVKSVKSGKLYQGSYGGCNLGPLHYAKVEHDDGLSTWYLHIFPN